MTFNKNNSTERITVSIKELADMLSVGRNTALVIAEEAGAGIKFGRRKLYSVERIKDYMSEQAKEQNNDEQ